MIRHPPEGLPSTSAPPPAPIPKPPIPNYAIPEELLASVVGPWNRWRVVVIAVFCVIMVFDGLNLFTTALLFPQDIKFNCTEGPKRANACFLANGSRCHTFEFSKHYGHTLTEEWKLICGKRVTVAVSKVSFRCGIAIGYVMMGHFADRWGRKTVIFTCLLLQPCSAVFVTASKSYGSFTVSRFFNGLALSGTPLLAVVLTSEISSNIWRTFDLGLLSLCFAIGHTLLPFVWMIFADSMKNLLLLSIPQSLLIVFMGTIRESPNWLLCKNKTTSAESVLIAVARFNGHKMPSSFRLRPVQIINTRSTRSLGIFTMFGTTKVRWVMVGLYLIWSLTAFINGLLMALLMHENEDHMKMILLLGTTSIVAAIMTIILCHVIKHKLIIALCSILGAIAVTVSHVVIRPKNNQDMYLLIQLVAYGLHTVALFAIWNLTPRIFPTETRAGGTGVAIAIGLLSFTLAELLLPFVFNKSTAYLATLWSCVAVIVLCCLLLVSVHKRELPDMIEDAVNFRAACKPTRWSTLRDASPTIDEMEIKIVDFERGTSLASDDPILPRLFRKGK